MSMEIKIGEDNEEISVDVGKTEDNAPQEGTKEWFRSKASEGTEPEGNTEGTGSEPAQPAQPTGQQPTDGGSGTTGTGYDHIDFEKASPKEIQERFNRLYRQLKASDSNFSELKAQNKALMDQFDELRKEKHTQKKQDELKKLQDEAVEHQRMGDYEKANELLREHVKKELADDDFVPLEQEIKRKQEENMPIEQKFIMRMNPEQQDKVAQFLEQHPYAVNDAIKAAALRRGADYWQANPEMPLRRIAEEIDKELNRLGEQYRIQPKNVNPNINKNNSSTYSEVGVGEQVSKASGNVVRLSKEQGRVARKMFSHLPPEQAYKKYAEQLQMTERL